MITVIVKPQGKPAKSIEVADRTSAACLLRDQFGFSDLSGKTLSVNGEVVDSTYRLNDGDQLIVTQNNSGAQ